MFAVVAAVLLAVATILQGTQAHINNAWFTPTTLALAGLTFLALHFARRDYFH
jgi:hypothetical protein